MEQRPLCAIIPTNGRKETSLVRSTNSLNRTLSRSPRGGGTQVSRLPHTARGGGGEQRKVDGPLNECVFLYD